MINCHTNYIAENKQVKLQGINKAKQHLQGPVKLRLFGFPCPYTKVKKKGQGCPRVARG